MKTTKAEIVSVLQILDRKYPSLPMLTVHATTPFRLLVAIILSQRSKDSVTVPLAQKLFKRVSTPQDFQKIPLLELEKIIQPIGFYKVKAKALKKLSNLLMEKYAGHVPSTEQELLSLPQVGHKTANILLTTFFNTPKIAVDTHVHRITNRLGWVHATSPLKTEEELSSLIPFQFHSIVNRVFVMHGQHICLPRIPRCSQCPIAQYCKKVGVTQYV